MNRITEETCARCDHRLASSNRHPDRICAVCQRELGSYRDHVESALRAEWIASGKPKITRIHGARRPITQLTPSDIATMPTDLLIATVRELARRRLAGEIAEMILS